MIDLSLEFALFLLTGACTGLLSGLLGIGGGLVIVPALLYLLAPHQIPVDHLMHVALGTSLASIIFTGASSAASHHRRGSVDWHIFRRLATGIVLGTLLGSMLASIISTDALKLIFVAFVTYAGTHLMLDETPPPSRNLPGTTALFSAGTLIGVVSSLVGIGGGTMTVPFLVRCNCNMRRAVGTSAAVGLPIALAGTLGYTIAGMHTPGMPPYTLGYVYLPAVVGITSASMLTAPVGVRFAHTLPVPTLKKLFAMLLFAIGAKMLWGVL
jgi:uncharacterized membrane protein YfcA